MARKTLYPRFMIKLPWWMDLILAAIVYYVFKFWLPVVHVKYQMLNRFLHALPSFAEIFAAILIVNAVFSAVHAWRNKTEQ